MPEPQNTFHEAVSAHPKYVTDTEDVSALYNRVYMAIPEKRRFILSRKDGAVYMHYLAPIPATPNDATCWKGEAAGCYPICETKLLADQEKVFYIAEPDETKKVFIINDGTPTFLSEENEHDEKLVPLNTDEQVVDYKRIHHVPRYHHSNPVPMQRRGQNQGERHGEQRQHWTAQAQSLLCEIAKEGISPMQQALVAEDSNERISSTTLLVMGIDNLLQTGQYEALKNYAKQYLDIKMSGHRITEISLEVLNGQTNLRAGVVGDTKVQPSDFCNILNDRVHVRSLLANNLDDETKESINDCLMIGDSSLRRWCNKDKYDQAVKQIDRLRENNTLRKETRIYKIILEQLRTSFRERATNPRGQYQSSSESSPVRFKNRCDYDKDAEFGRLLSQEHVTRKEVEALVNKSTGRKTGGRFRLFAPTTKREFTNKIKEHPSLSPVKVST